MSPANSEITRVRQVVDQLNAAWRAGRFEEISPIFHQQAVIVDGEHRRQTEGRGACVESYRAFVTAAIVEEYGEGPLHIDLFGSTAVVTYSFTIQYLMGGKGYLEAGVDCLVLGRQGSEQWQVLWRQVVWRAA
jgi:hypothetical protein